MNAECTRRTPIQTTKTWRSCRHGTVSDKLAAFPVAQSDLKSALASLQRGLQRAAVPYMVIGGIAVIARGVPRHTQDIDATIAAEGLDLAGLLVKLRDQLIEPRIDACLEFARKNQILLLRHTPSNTDIDLSLAWLPFEHEAIARAQTMSLRGIEIQGPITDIGQVFINGTSGTFSTGSTGSPCQLCVASGSCY